MLATSPSVSNMPLDALALCDVLARILYRCLKDQDARALLFPSLSEHARTRPLPEEWHEENLSSLEKRMTGQREKRTIPTQSWETSQKQEEHDAFSA